MWPAMMQKERPIDSRPTKVACWRMLTKMPVWKKCGIVDRAEQQDRRRGCPRPDGRGRRRSKGAGRLRPVALAARWRCSSGRPRAYGHHLHRRRSASFRLPQNQRFVDVGLGDRRTRDLQVRAPLLVGQLGLEADARRRCRASAARRAGSSAGTWRCRRPGRRSAARPRPAASPCGCCRAPTGAPLRRHHHDLAGLHALGLHDRRRSARSGGRRGQKTRSMSGFTRSWSSKILAGVGRPPTAAPPC